MTQPVDMTTADVTYSTQSYGARFAPALRLVNLSDSEDATVRRLEAQISAHRYGMELHDSYYRGTVRIQDLGISIPPQMRQLHTALGWPRVCVDALDERLDVEGFRYPSDTDVDEDLQGIWEANALGSESQLANHDALVFGRAYVAVGSGDGDGAPPLITVESPLDLAVEWDARTRSILNALRVYGFEGTKQATLYTPDETVSLVWAEGGWTVIERDQHKLGMCPIVRIANRPRSYDHDGTSEITPEVMSITDSACRTLQGLEVAREFYSAPQRYILGASEEAFQAADGTPLSAWQTYLGRVLALESDAEGNTPTVGQFTPYDPSAFTKVVDMYAKIISSITGLPPHVLGYTTDNPASADAIRSSEMRLKLKADRKTRMFGTGWRDVMKLALLVRDGSLPADADRIATVWADTATPTPAATTDSVFKQVQMGAIPPTSDVTLELLGHDAVARRRLAQDRAEDPGRQIEAEVAQSLEAKIAKADKSIAADITTTTPGPTPPKTPSGG